MFTLDVFYFIVKSVQKLDLNTLHTDDFLMFVQNLH